MHDSDAQWRNSLNHPASNSPHMRGPGGANPSLSVITTVWDVSNMTQTPPVPGQSVSNITSFATSRSSSGPPNGIHHMRNGPKYGQGGMGRMDSRYGELNHSGYNQVVK